MHIDPRAVVRTKLVLVAEQQDPPVSFMNVRWQHDESEFWCLSGSDMATVSRGQAPALLSETDWISRLMPFPLRHVAVEDGIAPSFAKEGGRRSNPVAVMQPTKL